MLTRREIAERKAKMLVELRETQRDGALPGQMAVSQRELSARYGLSPRTVALEMQKLVAEGVLYTVPRVGTFIGRPKVSQPDCYLFVLPPPLTSGGHSPFINAARRGFEERIAELGGATLPLSLEVAMAYARQGNLPELAGVFEWTPLSIAISPDVPRVNFGRPQSTRKAKSPSVDAVDFDNVAGGEQATRHLLQMDYRQIAFLGLHAAKEKDFPAMHWSAERERGWQQALEAAAHSWQGLSFLPAVSASAEHQQQYAAAREAAAQLVCSPNITAVVAVNEFAGRALLEELAAAQVQPALWPAIVCFDDYSDASEHIISSLHLPYEEIGRTAAQMLWERKNGRLTGPAQQRVVPMRLVRRLTCRPDWKMSGPLPSLPLLSQ